ncbi:hypothetical protein V6Z11_A01G050200 [Gossypium hirsutum]
MLTDVIQKININMLDKCYTDKTNITQIVYRYLHQCSSLPIYLTPMSPRILVICGRSLGCLRNCWSSNIKNEGDGTSNSRHPTLFKLVLLNTQCALQLVGFIYKLFDIQINSRTRYVDILTHISKGQNLTALATHVTDINYVGP